MYKYNKMIIKALNILNKLYSSKMNMFNIAAKAQVNILSRDASLCWHAFYNNHMNYYNR